MVSTLLLLGSTALHPSLHLPFPQDLTVGNTAVSLSVWGSFFSVATWCAIA